MRLVLIGPPGAGKGTLAAKLVEKYGVPHISTGDMFRAAIAQDSDLGRSVKSVISSGKLVSDDLTFEVVSDRLSQADVAEGFLLDGFPRNEKQAEWFTNYLKSREIEIDAALELDVNKDMLIKRLTGRRICPECRSVYNVNSAPADFDGKCKCGATLIQRSDDSLETVTARLDLYENQTAVLLDYYKKLNKLVTVDGNGTPEEVLDAVIAAL